MPPLSVLRTTGTPVLALLLLALVWNRELGPVLVALVAVVLVGAVLVAVHHAEVVAHRVGEPFGSLILAVAVTIIEVGLILSITASGGPQTATLARDTVFAAIMITCNGIVGLSLLVGAVRHHVVEFQAAGSGGAFAAVITLATAARALRRGAGAARGHRGGRLAHRRARQRYGARRRGAPRDLRGVPVVAVIP